MDATDHRPVDASSGIGLAVPGTRSRHAPASLSDVAHLGARMRQLVSTLGGVLALAILATAARWQAIEALPSGEFVPNTIILLWGLLFALVLGALYVPVHQTWATTTEELISEEKHRQFPDDASRGGTPGFRAPELAAKKGLEATLGLGGALKTLQGSIAVLGPVIAATVTSLFSRG